MKIIRLSLTCAAILVFEWAAAQVKLPVPRNFQNAIHKGTRTLTGKPGDNYWVNTAKYRVDYKFDPGTRLVSGKEVITYINKSPDDLQHLTIKLFPNLYQQGAPHNSFIRPEDQFNGVQLSAVKINGNTAFNGDKTPKGTNYLLRIPPLHQGDSVEISLCFAYTLNEKSHQRTGEVEPGAYFIAYSFPRVAVYDDLDGWDRTPYLGQDEFYNDNSEFDVRITVPGDYVVWATGDLQNYESILTPAVAQRYEEAGKSDKVITVIDPKDIKNKKVTRPAATHTWHFTAKDVPDFAFATSNHYMWHSSSVIVDSTTNRRTRVDAVFNKKHKDYFDVIHYARATVHHMSHTFPKWPYPYSHETIFDGLDQMEYPMMVNDNPVTTKADAIELTVHEIFHTMFPFYMGINETKYAWMDEGWATIGEWLISPMIDSTIVDEYGIGNYSMNAGKDIDIPTIYPTTQQTSPAYFLNAYAKPAMGYLYVKEMLGEELFNKALHFYIEQWHGKHPAPIDFFLCMNIGSGKNLNWFWKKWFYETGYPDLAISKVKMMNTSQYSLIISCLGNKPVPVHLVIHFADGSREHIKRSIAVWERGNKSINITVSSPKPIEKFELTDPHVPDVNKTNNIYILSKNSQAQ